MADALRSASGWRAELALSFERRGPRTVLARERHTGPMLIQKALYPEGPSPCHAIVLHPPAGIAAGDSLSLGVACADDAEVLVTTPGATRWYRSTLTTAASETRLMLAPGATLEYLPREAIVFDGARARAVHEIEAAAGARALGWDLWCLGRTAAGERFRSGRLELATRLSVDGRIRWEERGVIDGDAPLLTAAAGFDAQPVFGTLWAIGPELARADLDASRALSPAGSGRAANTQLPGVLLGRYLGPSTEEAFAWFTALWSLLRPPCLGRQPVLPRIWSA